MWCFISSPRRVLASVLVAFCLCLCCMTLFAYWDGPRLDTASVDNDLMDLFVGDFDVSFGLGQTHINAKWDCPDKNGKQRYDAETLCDRLRAANFLKDFPPRPLRVTAACPSCSTLTTMVGWFAAATAIVRLTPAGTSCLFGRFIPSDSVRVRQRTSGVDGCKNASRLCQIGQQSKKRQTNSIRMLLTLLMHRSGLRFLIWNHPGKRYYRLMCRREVRQGYGSQRKRP